MGNRVSSMLQDEEIKLISEETGFPPARVERLYTRFKSLDKSGICGSLSRQDFLRVPELAINPLCDRIVHMFFVDCDEDHDRINFRQFMKVLATFRSSNKLVRSRNASRQESIQYQNIFSSSSQNKFRHSRHSSCDGLLNYYPTHHTTNQHSIHYVASTTHLASSLYSYSHNNNLYHFNNSDQKTVGSPVDPDEPANSKKQKLYFMFKIYDVDNDNLISLNDLKKILKMMVGDYISEDKLTDMAARTLNQADRNKDGYIDFDEFCAALTFHLRGNGSSNFKRDIDDLLRVKFP